LLAFFFLLQFLRVSKGIEKGIFKLPSEREQKRLNTHHRTFFVFNLFGETLGCQIYLFFLLGFVWNGFNLQFDQNFLASKRERSEENNTDRRNFFVVNLCGETLDCQKKYIYFLGLFGMDSTFLLVLALP
jgi:hypothetical protein